MKHPSNTTERKPEGVVWDLAVRVFHWALVALVVALIVSGKIGGNALDWHKRFGYAVLALVLFRILWGFVGGTHARFASFVRGPRHALSYLGEITGRTPARFYAGHNPLGGWSVVMMLLALGVQAGTGLFSNDDIMIEGPLFKLVSKETSDSITGIHELNAYVVFALVGLHVAAILYYWLVKRDNLVLPMITGRKPLPTGTAEARGGHPLLALAVFGVAAAIVYYVVMLL